MPDITLPDDFPGADRLGQASNLTSRVTELLLGQITGGQYALGDVLPPEQQIADRFGVSRTILREAVARLKAEGYVTSKQGRGLIVTSNRRPAVLRMHAPQPDDHAEVLAIVELRQGFEMTAASLAAQRRTPEDLDAMRDAVDRMREALRTGDVSAGEQADLDFHRAIAIATRNEHFVSMFEFIAELYKKNLTVSREGSRRAGRAADAQSEHEQLFQAIEAGDSARAAERASIHVDNTARRLKARQAKAAPAAKPTARKTSHDK